MVNVGKYTINGFYRVYRWYGPLVHVTMPWIHFGVLIFFRRIFLFFFWVRPCKKVLLDGYHSFWEGPAIKFNVKFIKISHKKLTWFNGLEFTAPHVPPELSLKEPWSWTLLPWRGRILKRKVVFQSSFFGDSMDLFWGCVSLNDDNNVDGWNPVNSPVEVGSLSHDLEGFIHSRWLALGFLNHQQPEDKRLHRTSINWVQPEGWKLVGNRRVQRVRGFMEIVTAGLGKNRCLENHVFMGRGKNLVLPRLGTESL